MEHQIGSLVENAVSPLPEYKVARDAAVTQSLLLQNGCRALYHACVRFFAGHNYVEVLPSSMMTGKKNEDLGAVNRLCLPIFKASVFGADDINPIHTIY